MKLKVVNLLPIAYSIEKCTLDGEEYSTGFMSFFKKDDKFCVDINMEGMKFQTFEYSLDALINKINDHIDFGRIYAKTVENIK
jgi:hypothetical protein